MNEAELEELYDLRGVANDLRQRNAELEAELAGVRAGTHWIAPTNRTLEMYAAMKNAAWRGDNLWNAARDAYLAEQKEAGGEV